MVSCIQNKNYQVGKIHQKHYKSSFIIVIYHHLSVVYQLSVNYVRCSSVTACCYAQRNFFTHARNRSFPFPWNYFHSHSHQQPKSYSHSHEIISSPIPIGSPKAIPIPIKLFPFPFPLVAQKLFPFPLNYFHSHFHQQPKSYFHSHEIISIPIPISSPKATPIPMKFSRESHSDGNSYSHMHTSKRNPQYANTIINTVSQ